MGVELSARAASIALASGDELGGHQRAAGLRGPLGFDAYELRDEEGIRRHWTLVFAAYSAARQANAQGCWGKWLKAKLQTVGDVSRQVQSEALAALIYFALSELTQGRSTKAIVDLLVSPLRP